jgi:ubiquinone/menaquinone biosynthesis C-methylase UbiE
MECVFPVGGKLKRKSCIKKMADTVNRFSNRVNDYKKFRPSYPAEILDPINEIGLTESSVVADLGSGTGIFTQIILKSGCQVYAVEPNESMREIAELNLSQNANFKSVNGTGENTNLPDHSIDIITVAQAFHWFDIEKSRTEFIRILKKEDRKLKL